MEKTQLPTHVTTGFSRAEWHDKAWALYQDKTFSDTQLAKVSMHTIRAVFDATFDAMPAAKPAQAAKFSMPLADWKHTGSGFIHDMGNNYIGQFVGDWPHRDRMILAVNREQELLARIAALEAQIAG